MGPRPNPEASLLSTYTYYLWCVFLRFLAVDMQLYIVCAVLTLLLGRWPRVAVKILTVCIFGSMLMNFAIIYNWQLKPMVQLMIPE